MSKVVPLAPVTGVASVARDETFNAMYNRGSKAGEVRKDMILIVLRVGEIHHQARDACNRGT